MRALSIRQPFAELILRGIKTVEYRSRPTRIIGERFHIYASRSPAGKFWSRDLAMPGELPPWMLELAEQIKLIPPDLELPRGVIVGSAVIEKCERVASGQLPVVSGETRDRSLLGTDNSQLATPLFRWHLADVERAKKLRKPKGQPQPVWFEPF